MYTSPIRFSAQAIIITPNGDIVLEDNKKIGRLSLIGGAKEESDADENKNKEALNTIRREVWEELGILFDAERFMFPQIQPITRFGTGLWKSTYFVLKITSQEIECILQNDKIRCYSEMDLRENY